MHLPFLSKVLLQHDANPNLEAIDRQFQDAVQKREVISSLNPTGCADALPPACLPHSQ
jgi:hypothetical protein